MSFGGVGPAQVLEHQDARQQDRTGVDLVHPGVLGRRAVGRFEDPVAGHVVDVRARGDPDAADLGRERVREVVAVQVHRRDDVELRGARERLLEADVGDDVLHEQLRTGLAVAVVPADRDVVELVLHQLVAPLHEGALGELLDVALVDQGDRLALVLERVDDGGADQSLRALLRDRLDTDAAHLADVPAEALLQEARSFSASGEPASTSSPA